MTATDPRDRETVRSLLREHLPSGFRQDVGPLTVGSVACHIQHEWQMGRLSLLRTDKVINDRVLGCGVLLPVDLSERSVRALLATVGVVEDNDALAPYWSLFLEMTHELVLERGRPPLGGQSYRWAALDAVRQG